MTRRQIEAAYDNVRYSDKDMAGLPTRFYLLDDAVINFLENFADLLDKPDEKGDNVEDIRLAKELLGEASAAMSIVLERMGEYSE